MNVLYLVNCFPCNSESIMSGNPVSLTSGSLSIPNSDIICSENEFGVVQSPHQDSYMIGHNRQHSLMEPWDKSTIKPIEILAKTSDIPELAEQEIPDVVIDSPTKEAAAAAPSSSQSSMPKMMQIYDEYHEEMFQLDDENDDELGPDPVFSTIKSRKMSRSTNDLHPINEDSIMEASTSSKHLQKFRSDSNLHSGESNMSLVEKVTMLNLTATKKKDAKSSQSPLIRVNSEEQITEEGSLKSWFFKKPVTVSHREMNAISSFPS